MGRDQRKLAKCHAQLVAKLLFHLFEYRMEDAARRTLKVAKLFELRRSICWPTRIRRFCSRDAFVGNGLSSCSLWIR